MSKSQEPRESGIAKDPRGTMRGLPDEHLAETGLRDAADGGRESVAEGLYKLEIERDADGRPLGIGADLKSAEITGDPRAHTDAAGIHSAYPIDQYDPEKWRASGDGWGVVDDLLEHWWLDAPDGQLVGGPFALLNGPPGKGKSTAMRTIAARWAECNGHRLGEKVIWRGSPSRDEWLALAPWARVLLPANADVDVTLSPKRPADAPVRDARLSNYVREVVTYDDPVDALEQARAGGINVVYPDPTFSGAEELYRSIPNRRVDEIPSREELFHESDPLPHWWIALLLAAVDGRDVSTPIGFVWDEIKEIAREGAMKDSNGSYQKIHDLGGALSGEMRKKGVAMIGAGHGESAISAEWRNKMHYRFHSAGREAPQSASGLQGFDETPFYHNINKGKNAGEGVLFSSERFEELTWPNIQTPLPAYTLGVEVSAP